MYLLSVNLYEFGQFLQILLWISLPMVLAALLITTWLHYRKKRRQEQEEGELVYQDEKYQDEKPRFPNDRLAIGLFAGEPAAALPEESGNAYRGLLWMKDKYEQYREQTDRKCERLREELAQSEKKYLDLLILRTAASQAITATSEPALSQEMTTPRTPALPQVITSRAPALPQDSPLSQAWVDRSSEEAFIRALVEEKESHIGLLQTELDQRIKNYHQLEYQRREDMARAEELSGLLLQEKDKVADLTAKLEDNTRLLLRIHQELDKSLNTDKNGPAEGTKIVGWVEFEEDTPQIQIG